MTTKIEILLLLLLLLHTHDATTKQAGCGWFHPSIHPYPGVEKKRPGMLDPTTKDGYSKVVIPVSQSCSAAEGDDMVMGGVAVNKQKHTLRQQMDISTRTGTYGISSCTSSSHPRLFLDQMEINIQIIFTCERIYLHCGR